MMMGPGAMSKGMFMPGRGVRMSENRITPSGLNACHGCREISTWWGKRDRGGGGRNEVWVGGGMGRGVKCGEEEDVGPNAGQVVKRCTGRWCAGVQSSLGDRSECGRRR